MGLPGAARAGGSRGAGRLRGAAVARGGVRAWQYLRRHPVYRKACLRSWPGPGLPEGGPFPVRLQTRVDLRAARWGLLAWEDPWEAGTASPFWALAPMLEAGVAPGVTPLMPRLEALGATVSGLRLADGVLILKFELGRAAAQLRIGSGSVPGREDGLVAEHDLLQAPSAFIASLEDACALAAGEVPPPGVGGRGTKTRNF